MMENNAQCRTLCEVTVSADEARFINDRISEDYALNWLIDGLPAAEMKVDTRTQELFFDMGFNLGNDTGPHRDAPLLHNHYDIVLRCVRRIGVSCGAFVYGRRLCRYHQPTPESYRIVGVLVWPLRYAPLVVQSVAFRDWCDIPSLVWVDDRMDLRIVTRAYLGSPLAETSLTRFGIRIA
jgi:hypothetical protein